MSLTKC